MLELFTTSKRIKDTLFYSLHVLKNGEPIFNSRFDIEKDGELWLSNQEFIFSAWSNSTTNPKKNVGNPAYAFGFHATFRVRESGTDVWSNEAEL